MKTDAIHATFAAAAALATAASCSALVEEYKLVASQFKGKKKEEPAPEPESAPEATTIS